MLCVAKNKFERWRERFGLEYVRRLAEDGLSDEEIAARSGIELSTYRKWRTVYPQFAAAIELGRTGSDYAVVEALYKKAVGYRVPINKTVKLKRVEYDPETGKKVREYEELAVAVDESYVPPDLRAETFWLKNRQPERWQDKPEGTQDEESDGIWGGVEIPSADMIDTVSDG